MREIKERSKGVIQYLLEFEKVLSKRAERMRGLIVGMLKPWTIPQGGTLS
jgi:hypothetical protein